jgi:hypothetical protein
MAVIKYFQSTRSKKSKEKAAGEPWKVERNHVD